MSGTTSAGPKSRITHIEEGIISAILAIMTLVTFSQVVARYGFNSGWNGALELTRVLFAWLILFGMSYGIKVGAHLGVDAFVKLLPKPMYRAAAMASAVACIMYAVVLFSSDWLQMFGVSTKGGAWFYWSKMFKLGIGLDDLHWPVFIQEAFGMQDRVQRWIAYLVLPLGLALLAYRSVEALVQIIRGQRDLMIASHEAEELVEESRGALADDDDDLDVPQTTDTKEKQS